MSKKVLWVIVIIVIVLAVVYMRKNKSATVDTTIPADSGVMVPAPADGTDTGVVPAPDALA